MADNAVPFIDPRVRHVGVSALREFNATNLKAMEKAVVVSSEGQALVVILPFKTFIAMQEAAGGTK